jgi:hypothetical protein
VYFRHAPGESVMVVLNKSSSPLTLDLDRFREDLPAGATARDVVRDEGVVLGERWTAPARSATVFEIRTDARAAAH